VHTAASIVVAQGADGVACRCVVDGHAATSWKSLFGKQQGRSGDGKVTDLGDMVLAADVEATVGCSG
jgi:hypothetical protein